MFGSAPDIPTQPNGAPCYTPKPLDTELFEEGHRPFYRIKTHSTLTSSTTTIIKTPPNGPESTLAEVEWGPWSGRILRFQVTIMGEQDVIGGEYIFGRYAGGQLVRT
jgi:hypothetical protein